MLDTVCRVLEQLVTSVQQLVTSYQIFVSGKLSKKMMSIKIRRGYSEVKLPPTIPELPGLAALKTKETNNIQTTAGNRFWHIHIIQ